MRASPLLSNLLTMRLRCLVYRIDIAIAEKGFRSQVRYCGKLLLG